MIQVLYDMCCDFIMVFVYGDFRMILWWFVDSWWCYDDLLVNDDFMMILSLLYDDWLSQMILRWFYEYFNGW